MVTLFDNDAPASSFVRDAHAVASTSVDWKETASEHVFKADMPGLCKEDVQVEVEEGHVLSISGQRKREGVQKTDTWHRVERSSEGFLRKFRLPENANLDGITAKVDSGVANLDSITAKVDSGVLTVVVPKVERRKQGARRIEIDGGEAQPATIASHEEKKAEEDGAATPAQAQQ